MCVHEFMNTHKLMNKLLLVEVMATIEKFSTGFAGIVVSSLHLHSPLFGQLRFALITGCARYAQH